MADTVKALAKIDAMHARKLGDMMVNDTQEYVVKNKIFEIGAQNPKHVLQKYLDNMKNFTTAPFDPTGEMFRFYDTGYTVWSGYPGAGKTTLLRQLCLHLLFNHKRKVFFASLEEDPDELLVNLCAVAFGCYVPSIEQLEYFIDYYCENLRLWGVVGMANHRELFGAIDALSQDGVTHCIIDSLMCLDVNGDNNEEQRQFANLMTALVRTRNIHIHLVAHPRKTVSVEQEPDINDIGGSANIGRMAWNVLFVRRGKSLEGVRSELSPMKILIKKQRKFRGQLGEITGTLNKDINQFKVNGFEYYPTRYLPDNAYTIATGNNNQ